MQKKILLYGLLFFIGDILSKLIISSLIKLNDSIVIIENFFSLTYVHNFGAAWSILKDKRLFLILISVGALVVIIKYIKDFKDNFKNRLAFSLLIGGLMGNLYDRIIYGYVRDFLDFKIFNYNYPIFNIADIFIFCGILLLIIAVVKGEDNGSKSSK